MTWGQTKLFSALLKSSNQHLNCKTKCRSSQANASGKKTGYQAPVLQTQILLPTTNAPQREELMKIILRSMQAQRKNDAISSDICMT
jgi:hypothetical protein